MHHCFSKAVKTSFIAALVVLVSACSGSRPAYLGSVQTSLQLCPNSPNCVSSLSEEEESHKIAPLLYTDKQAVHTKLVNAIAQNPAAEIIVDDPNYLYAEYTSAVMGYVDDVEFLFNADKQIIDVRSASRLGHSDFGVNRDRIETIRTQLGN